jgi:hypothetical protein
VPIAVYVLVSALISIYLVRAEETKEGGWFGRQFVLHAPVHVFTATWTPDDNGSEKKFKVPMVEPNSVVRYRVDVDGGGDRVEVCISLNSNFLPWDLPLLVGGPGGGHRARYLGRTGSAKTNKSRELSLFVLSLPDTVPSVIRVFVLSFEV